MSGASVAWEASIKKEPTADEDWFPVTDLQGNPVTMSTTQVGEMIVENAVWYRPNVTGGDGSTAIEAQLFSKAVR
jgi:hypothetical protein